MSSKTNQSLSGKCAHLYEVKYFPALSLGRLYLMGEQIRRGGHRHLEMVNISTFSSTCDEQVQVKYAFEVAK
jgi:hypothetical protein